MRTFLLIMILLFIAGCQDWWSCKCPVELQCIDARIWKTKQFTYNKVMCHCPIEVIDCVKEK
jgi:hypothetical protein